MLHLILARLPICQRLINSPTITERPFFADYMAQGGQSQTKSVALNLVSV
jgi:hypothetical protein